MQRAPCDHVQPGSWPTQAPLGWLVVQQVCYACASSCGDCLQPMNLQGAHAAAASLSLSVSIQGLGPRFRLLISLVNEGTELATDLQVG